MTIFFCLSVFMRKYSQFHFIIILLSIRVLDIFSWLIEVENVTKENRDSGKIIWSVNFVQDAGRMQNYSSEVLTSTMPFEGKRQKIIARFQIMKDDIQSILPIAKVFTLLLFEKCMTILQFFFFNDLLRIVN